MAEFFDHPQTGVLHFRAMAGGFGGGATSFYEAPAKPADIAAYPQAHASYLKAKRHTEAKTATESEPAPEVSETTKIEAPAEADAKTNPTGES